MESVTIYPDDKEEVERAVRRASERLSATGLAEADQVLLEKSRVRKPRPRPQISP